jgi:single-strand DNA-binding protein
LSQDINSVIVVGRLTRDGELTYTSGGFPILKFAIGSNKRRKVGEQWEDEASFFDCVLVGKYGEVMAPFLMKGTQVVISGQIHQDRWESQGEKRSKVIIRVENVQITKKPGENNGNGPKGYPADHRDPASPQFKDDIPFTPRGKIDDSRIPF